MDMSGVPAPHLTVTQLNARAKQLLERQFTQVWVAGEVSNVRFDPSGHCWFCLKDSGSAINAVLFCRDARALRFVLKDGLQVVANGRLTIYTPSGRYQLVVNRLEPCGLGALQAAFEALKKRLQAEGLFAPQRKRPLPRVPRRVAVITSPTGAVIRDIVQVSQRRFPNCQILLLPVRVQGAECSTQVAAALHQAAHLREAYHLDVVILARGGGSLEDLSGFNDERVARAIAACPIPVVSAVGHETDFTIADFVADLRAPTPSAAAELVFAKKSELHFLVQHLQGRLSQSVRRCAQAYRLRLRAARAELGDGRQKIMHQAQRLSVLQTRLEQAMAARQKRARQVLHEASLRLGALHPRVRLQTLKTRLTVARTCLDGALAVQTKRRQHRLALHTPTRLSGLTRRHLSHHQHRLGRLAARLGDLSPLGILARGYGIVLDDAGTAVRSPADVSPGDLLHIRVANGSFSARVSDVSAPD